MTALTLYPPRDSYGIAQAIADKQAAKAERAKLETLRSRARALIAGWPHCRFEEVGREWGVSAWKARAELETVAQNDPQRLIAAASLFTQEVRWTSSTTG